MQTFLAALRARLLSFRHAGYGLAGMLREEVNARLHLLATVVAVATGVLREISATRWAVLALTIGAVWAAEAFNTAIEHLCDLVVGKAWHPRVKRIKDLSAAAVLITAIAAVASGVAILFF